MNENNKEDKEEFKFGQKVYVWDSGNFPCPLRAVIISGTCNSYVHIAIEPYRTTPSAKRIENTHVERIFKNIADMESECTEKYKRILGEFKNIDGEKE